MCVDPLALTLARFRSLPLDGVFQSSGFLHFVFFGTPAAREAFAKTLVANQYDAPTASYSWTYAHHNHLASVEVPLSLQTFNHTRRLPSETQLNTRASTQIRVRREFCVVVELFFCVFWYAMSHISTEMFSAFCVCVFLFVYAIFG